MSTLTIPSHHTLTNPLTNPSFFERVRGDNKKEAQETQGVKHPSQTCDRTGCEVTSNHHANFAFNRFSNYRSTKYRSKKAFRLRV